MSAFRSLLYERDAKRQHAHSRQQHGDFVTQEKLRIGRQLIRTEVNCMFVLVYGNYSVYGEIPTS